MNELFDVQLQKWNYQCEYLEKWAQLEEKLGKEVDAIIAPITPTAAILHNQFKYCEFLKTALQGASINAGKTRWLCFRYQST